MNTETARIVLRKSWKENTPHSEYTLHQLSPYIGKLKSSIARGLILHFTKKGQTIYDPYCGASTIPLEGCILNRNVIANDLNPYAHLLSRAKLFPPSKLSEVLLEIENLSKEISDTKQKIDLRKVPKWVRQFFHKETLKEIILWVKLLKQREHWFLLSCLLGILHHQRPGFLSFPSSHTVPYLRLKKFPPDKFPELYQYRSVKERLIKKAERAFKRMPVINDSVNRTCLNGNASIQIPNLKVDAVITSPPYMRQLDYARDNRLRLWFLDCNAWKSLDKVISPSENEFIKGIKTALNNWKKCLNKSGKCILILGDSFCSSYKLYLPEAIEKIATQEMQEYKLIFKMQNLIPDKKRVRKNYRGNKYETILVFEKK